MNTATGRIAAGTSLLLPALCAAQAQFIPLGSPTPSQSSTPVGINADGTVVVGYVNPIAVNAPVRWTVNPQPSIAAIGLPSGFATGGAMSVSDSGAAVLGWQQQVSVFKPFRWTAPGPSVALPVPATWSGIRPRAISPDGTFAVGSALTMPGIARAIRWTGTQDPELLPMLPLGQQSIASAADGSGAIYGSTHLSNNTDRMIKWTAAGPASLATLPTGDLFALPMRVSLDGQHIVGLTENFSTTPFAGQTWLWTAAGFQTLPNLPGAHRCVPTGLADNGSMVVGFCESGPTIISSGFIWTLAGGTREVSQVLTSLGAAFPGWQLQTVTGCSRDGRVIIGTGINPGGVPEGWLARLPEMCYPDCNANGTLTVADFGCFQTSFAAGSPYADCNADGLLTVPDFGCFQTKFVLGCP